jgi:hypothetical protein
MVNACLSWQIHQTLQVYLPFLLPQGLNPEPSVASGDAIL